MPRITNPATKKKPGPKGWAMPEQWDFLLNNCPEFRVAQGAKGKKSALDDFWKKIVALFLEEFGIDAENEELLKFWRGRLKHWFNNHGNKDEPSAVAVRSLLPKADTRRLKPVELYSQLYYPTRVQATVKTKIEEEAIPKPQVLNCIRTTTQEAWSAESEEVKEEIMRLWTAQAKPEPSKSSADMTPEDYAAAYKAVEVQVSKFIAALGAATGGCISVFFGACDPNAGGKIRTRGYHFGKDPEGKSFAMAMPNYTDRFLKPFTSFVKKVFPPEVRAARTLVKKTTDDDADAVEEEADKTPSTPPVEPTEPKDVDEEADKPPPSPAVEPSEPDVNPTPAIPPAGPTTDIQGDGNTGDVSPIKKTKDGKKTDTNANANIINADSNTNDTEDVDAVLANNARDPNTDNSPDDAIVNDGGLSDDTDRAAKAVADEPPVNAEGNGNADGDLPVQPPVKARPRKRAIQALDTVVTPREKRIRVGPATREALTMAELAARRGGTDAAKDVVVPKKRASKSKK